MADRVYVHIGAPKSGTTFLQTLLWANQENLASAGVLLPGAKKFDHNHIANFVRSDRPTSAILKTWKRIEAQIREWPGPVILSNEWFSLASTAQIQHFVRKLQPAEVHIIFTARNLINTVPAAWQETLKLGYATPLDDFVASLEEPGDTPRWWWGTLDPAVVLSGWATAVPADHIQVVTVPNKSMGPNTLWERFAAAFDVDPGVCTTTGASANESVGAESARLLQLIGPELRKAVDAEKGHWLTPYRWIRSALAHSILAPIGGSKIALRDSDMSAIRARAEESVSAIKTAGYGVKGDLQDLRDGTLKNAVHPDDLTDPEVLKVALRVIPALLRRAKQESARLQKSRERIAVLEHEIRRLKRQESPRRPFPIKGRRAVAAALKNKLQRYAVRLKRSR